MATHLSFLPSTPNLCSRYQNVGKLIFVTHVPLSKIELQPPDVAMHSLPLNFCSHKLEFSLQSVLIHNFLPSPLNIEKNKQNIFLLKRRGINRVNIFPSLSYSIQLYYCITCRLYISHLSFLVLTIWIAYNHCTHTKPCKKISG